MWYCLGNAPTVSQRYTVASAQGTAAASAIGCIMRASRADRGLGSLGFDFVLMGISITCNGNNASKKIPS